MGENLFGGMFLKIRRSLLVKINQIERVEQIDQVLEAFTFDTDIQEAYERFYVRTSVDFAKIFIDSHKSIIRPLQTKSEDEWLFEVLEFVRTKTGALVSATMYTHREDMIRIAKAAVKQGIESGWGMQRIAREISKQQSQVDGWKAMRIARTETVRASNYGTELGAADLPGNKVKVWISSFDLRSREDHMAMDGVKVEPNQPFIVGGEPLMYPCDPNGSAEQTINCRCAHDYLITNEIFV